MPLSDHTTTVLADCKTFSENNIERMREAARNIFGDATEFLIGVNGSYARREATKNSDIDCFFLAASDDALPLSRKRQAEFREYVAESLDMKLPSSGGVFDQPLTVDDICHIGGQSDSNVTLTRRMLLLLEGEWLFNKPRFLDVRNRLLVRYLHDKPGKDKICMFLLNDIIRYWRTICIDLERKIEIGKSREIRLIKLRFSRMLLYASGVLTIGRGHGLCYEDKIQSLSTLFGKYPINRILSIAGEQATPVLNLYAEFLEALGTPDTRTALENESRNSRVFEEMRNKAGQFRDNLHCLFLAHFADDNPTLRALLL